MLVLDFDVDDVDDMLMMMMMLMMLMMMLLRPTALSGNAKALDHDCFVCNDAITVPTVTMMHYNSH